MSEAARAFLDWRYKGMKTLTLENELIRMVALPDKGCDVAELVYKPKNIDVMWHSPPGHRLPADHGGLIATPDSGFLDCYGGGWQDALPTIGSGPTELHGAKFGLHGETALLPWDVRVHEDGEAARAFLSVSGLRYPYLLEKTITLRRGESRLRISEKLTNTSSQTLEYYWIQHPSFGEPFLVPGCRLELPEGSMVTNLESINANGRVAGGEFAWPQVRGKDSSIIDLSVIPPKSVVAEETTFIRVKEGWYNLTNEVLGLRFRLEWDTSVFPWLWFWQNYSIPDYPHFGQAWNVAVEPATGLPTILGRGAAKDALILEGGESRTSELEVSLSSL